MERIINMLALDTATRHTGYAVFKNGRYEKSGCLSVKREESDPVDKMLTKISSLLKKYKPNIITNVLFALYSCHLFREFFLRPTLVNPSSF